MRILYLTQWFEPEPFIKGAPFVKALAERGHHIEVVTGFPNYPTGKLYEGYRVILYRRDVIDGITVHRVPLFPSHDGSSLGRILNYLSFLFSSAIFCATCARQFDVIYAYPPITVGLAAAFAGWIARKPFVLDIQDLWPDSVIKSGMPGTHRMGAILHGVCNFTYRRAKRIVSQSVGIKQRLIERGVPAEKIVVIYNWADEQAASPSGSCDLTPYDFAGHFNFVFGGNLGRVQGLDTVVRAAHLAQKQIANIRLLLIGNGIEEQNLTSLVSELKADNVVKIADGIPRSQIGDVFAVADVLVVHLWNDPLFEITIPSKVQFYLAMGKPILVGVKGEAAKFIADAGAGISATPQDVEDISAAMVRLATLAPDELVAMGRRARETYWHVFSFDKAVAETENGLLQAVGITSPKETI